MQSDSLDLETLSNIERVAEWVLASKRVVVFTGAGVSTESGIPDFRSPGGLWERYDPNEFLFQKFISNEESRKKYWKMNLDFYSLLKKIKPNKAHYACVELDRVGKLDCVITQNIDNLHQDAGLSPEKVIELHGNTMRVTCLTCKKEYPREEIQKELEKGVEVPYCEVCNGILKPATISFGQPMPERETREAEYRARNSDLFITVGSSLVVHPACLMPIYAKEGGAKLVIINLQPTPYDQEADIIIRGKAGDVLEQILQRTNSLALK